MLQIDGSPHDQLPLAGLVRLPGVAIKDPR
jgi:hypothetical protein